MGDIRIEDIWLVLAIYAGLVGIAFWLAMILWVYRDMKARSRDALARLLVAVVVGLLTLPGLLIYLFLRPRETLAEAYERSLEEEALLQEIEEKPVCPTCGIRTQESWQVCPSCHTRLKKLCVHCNRLLELSWNICPYCTAGQVVQQDSAEWYEANRQPVAYSVQEQPSRSRSRVQQSSESLEFVEGEEY